MHSLVLEKRDLQNTVRSHKKSESNSEYGKKRAKESSTRPTKPSRLIHGVARESNIDIAVVILLELSFQKWVSK